MRTISESVRKVLESDYGETKDVVIITLPEQFNPPSPEVTLYLANGEGIVVGGQEYSNKLRKLGAVKFSLGAAPDNTEISIENVSLDLGFVLTDTSKTFDGAKVVINRIFKIEDGSWEPVTLFVGQIKDVKIDQDLITLSAVSDMSKRGSNVASLTATQRCIWVFNVLGSGIGPNCGWQTSQPGNPIFCDHTVDGVDGCKSHGNLHRIGAVPAFTALNEPGAAPNPSTGGYDPSDGGGGGGWGTGSGGGWCVHPDTWILCENNEGIRYWVKAYNVKPRESVVTVDKFGNFFKTSVVDTSKGTTTELITITSEKGYSVSCSPSHPFITALSDTEGTPCHKLKVGQKTLSSTFDGKEVIEDTIISIERVTTNCNVILFQLTEPYHIYLGGSTKDGAFLFHNMKPMDTLDRFYVQ